MHRKFYSLVGLPLSVCIEVDRIIDFDSDNFFGFDVHDFGRQREFFFVLAVVKVFEQYDIAGLKCFLMHHVLDYLAYLISNRYSKEIILRKIMDRFGKLVNGSLDLVESVTAMNEIFGEKLSLDFHEYYRKYRGIYDIVKESMSEILSWVSNNIEALYNAIQRDLKRQRKLCDAIFSRLSGFIQHICWLALSKKLRKLRVPRQTLDKLSSAVRKSYYEWLCEHEHVFDDSILESIDTFVERFKAQKNLEALLKENEILGIIIGALVRIAFNEVEKLCNKTCND